MSYWVHVVTVSNRDRLKLWFTLRDQIQIVTIIVLAWSQTVILASKQLEGWYFRITLEFEYLFHFGCFAINNLKCIACNCPLPGPPEKEEFFYKIRDDSNKRIHHNLKDKARKDYRNTTEDWENATVSTVRSRVLLHLVKYVLERCLPPLLCTAKYRSFEWHYLFTTPSLGNVVLGVYRKCSEMLQVLLLF